MFFAIQILAHLLNNKTLAIKTILIIYIYIEHYVPNLIGLRPHPRATPSYTQSYDDIIRLSIAGSGARFWLKRFN